MVVEAKQHDKLMQTLAACWRLRNGLVADRKSNREANKELRWQGTDVKTLHYLTQSDQYVAVLEYVRKDTALSKVHSQVRQNVAVRVETGYERFFDALKEGKTGVNPPQYTDLKKYRSITYPQYGPGAHIKNSMLYLSNLGVFQLYDYRKIKGKPKTVTVKFRQGRWWAIVTAEIQEKDQIDQVLPQDIRPDAGIDTGLAVLMTDSFGHEYDPPKAWYQARGQLRTAQKKLSRQFEARKNQHESLVKYAKADNGPSLRTVPYSKRLKGQIKVVAKLHTKVERIRDYHHKKNASVIADRYSRVAVEEHSVQFMIKNKRLAKIASDRAIHGQKLALKSKLGKRYAAASNTRAGIGGNSQTCTCGASVPKELEDRVHNCAACGLSAGRDHVSANIVSIIAFGYASLSLASAAGQAVVRRGEDKTLYGESLQCEPENIPASESSVKRQPPVQGQNTTGAEATVAGKTIVHDRVRPVLPGEPKAVRCGPSSRRRHTSKDVKRADSA